MSTFHIHITGQVQGVGFRPFVYQAARDLGLKGWVNNTVDGVHIEINASPGTARRFRQYIMMRAPSLARITGSSLREVAHRDFKQFEIVRSNSGKKPTLMLTPDFALCEHCRSEFHDPKHARYHYPFISCTHCGPRFSIVRELPYDRENTTMAGFRLCPDCQREYDEPQNRRYYAQTNACARCTIELTLTTAAGKTLPLKQLEILDFAVEALKAGQILAVKGIGGFLLMCDATNATTVRRLREKKRRPAKPFAVLYPSLDALKKDVHLSTLQEKSLTGPISPMQLTRLKGLPPSGIAAEEVAPGLKHLGVMLPYAPLLENLVSAAERPLVATSGNLSGSPIVFQNDQALQELGNFAELILTHNRDIVVPQDDSVLKVASQSQMPILLRRSRGLAPGYWPEGTALQGKDLLALGAQLKSSFTLTSEDQIYVSQYLGNLESYDAQESYKKTLSHFFRVFNFKPEKVLVDLHPQYFTSIYGRELAAALQVEVHAIQHHEAHFAAVLAENNLMQTEEEVLGVIWDGTGLGTDGQTWGGEFFLYSDFRFNRISHFSYFPVLAGDKMAGEPRLSALSLVEEAQWPLEDKFNAKELDYYQKLLRKPAAHSTTSVGRLFDAVGSILNLTDFNTYEGEAALLLEDLALRYFRKCGANDVNAYPISLEDNVIDVRALVREVLDDLNSGESKAMIACKLHVTLVAVVKEVAEKAGVANIAFSGGVFQNGLLVDLLISTLGKDFQLFFHRQLSPNDENISLGQIAHFLIRDQKSLTPEIKRKVTYT